MQSPAVHQSANLDLCLMIIIQTPISLFLGENHNQKRTFLYVIEKRWFRLCFAILQTHSVNKMGL